MANEDKKLNDKSSESKEETKQVKEEPKQSKKKKAPNVSGIPDGGSMTLEPTLPK